MRALLAALALLPTLLWASPQRVVSLNLCTDQYLLMLADRTQIASLSALAYDPQQSFYAADATGIPHHQGQADQLVSLKPDLLLNSPFSNRRSSQLLTTLGYRVVEIPPAQNLNQVMEQITRVGNLLNRQARAATLIEQMKLRLHTLQQRVPVLTDTSPKLMQYSAGGFTTGPQTLTGELITLAGWRNSAIDAGIEYYGRVTLEQLLTLAPDRLLDVPVTEGSWSTTERQLQHPVLEKSGVAADWIRLPERLWNCGGPMLLDALEMLIEKREQLQSRPSL